MGQLLARYEKVSALALIVIFFLLNFSIATRSPFGGWMDEVSYADPGLNLAAGKGWISTAYPYETDRQFYSATPPLYALGLALWARIFGISMVSARTYCYTLAALGMLFLWLGTLRFNLLNPAYRLFWIVLLSTEYGMNWMERNERYDVWIFLGLALAWFGATLKAPVVRFPVIFMGCFLIPLAGFVGGPYVVLAGAMAACLTHMKFWKEALFAMAGATSGVLGVAAFYWSFGVLNEFMQCVHNTTLAKQIETHSPWKILLYPTDDYAVAVMIVILVILSIYYRLRPDRNALPWLLLGWGMVVLLPAMMVIRGVFVMMYFYMLIIPLSLAILELVRRTSGDPRGRYWGRAIMVAMAFLCLGGLPARLYTSWHEWDFRDPQHKRDFVRAYVRPDDSVYTDYRFYFELRDYAKFVAVPFYLPVFPEDEARQINVALVDDATAPDLTNDASPLLKIGGGWKNWPVFFS